LLAMRAPVKVASHVPRRNNRRATHQARCPGSAVDVDFAAVPVLPWSASGTARVVLGPDGVDPAATHPVAHQFDKIRPQRRPLIGAQLATWPQRIHLVAEQQLGAVDVADPDQY
jgi:hypothetical protein